MPQLCWLDNCLMPPRDRKPPVKPVSVAAGNRFAGQEEWVWLETLTRVRWLAVAGQAAALGVAYAVIKLDFPLLVCLAVVAVAALANMVNQLVFPRARRLSEVEVFLTLLFDLLQLALLLYLTGGLNNPFALLLLAPVTVGATTLQARATLLLAAIAVGLASLLAKVNRPMLLPDGTAFVLPDLFLLGFWAAVVIGILFLGLYSHRVARERHALAEALLATQLALAREQKLTDLGSIVAAAAHELGTPLATIKLTAAELKEALADQPELAADAELIRAQAERCRSILRTMGQPEGADQMLARTTLDALLTEASAPHADRGCPIELRLPEEGRRFVPEVIRRPEILHGLRNLIQNAVDFAENRVLISARWTEDLVEVVVRDDGPGFPPQLLARIGEPFLRNRRPLASGARRADEGLGLGLFIAKTLLERSGATLSFANAPQAAGGGAEVRILWPRAFLAAEQTPAVLEAGRGARLASGEPSSAGGETRAKK